MQADNIVINLADSPLTIGGMCNVLKPNPVSGLKRVFLMKGDDKIIMEFKS